MFRRTRHLTVVVVFLAISVAMVASPRLFERARTDVVLITLDTTRLDHLGLYGLPRGTPHLDRLAREGTTFRRAYSTAPWTLPAHCSILTGRRPSSHGATHGVPEDHAITSTAARGTYEKYLLPNRLPYEETTLAELLRARGYSTAAFIGGPYLRPEFGVLQGYQWMDARAMSIGVPAGDLTDAAVSWVERIPPWTPLHVLVNYFDPHGPYAPDPPFDHYPAARSPVTTSDDDITRGTLLSKAEQLARLDRYDAEILEMDFELGRLLGALRRMGRYERALIVVVADHGEHFGEHGRVGHDVGRLAEVTLRVPLVIRYPGGREGGRSIEEMVSVTDILPLMGRELGMDIPEEVEGVPIGRRQLVFAEVDRNASSIATHGREFDHDLESVVDWPWKLVLRDDGKARLYRLDVDPQETRDLAGHPVEKRLRAVLARERATVRPLGNAVRSGAHGALESLKALGYVH